MIQEQALKVAITPPVFKVFTWTPIANKLSYKKLVTQYIDVSTTSGTETGIGGVIGFPVYTDKKIVYAKVRDTAGPRAGYFFGSDTFFINYIKANGWASTLSQALRAAYSYTDESEWKVTFTSGSLGYGVYAKNVVGRMIQYASRYNLSLTGIVDSRFKIDIYLLDWPDDISPFEIV